MFCTSLPNPSVPESYPRHYRLPGAYHRIYHHVEYGGIQVVALNDPPVSLELVALVAPYPGHNF